MPKDVDALGPLTVDGFLGGDVQISQPRTGYRAGTDPVFLAASVLAEPGQEVLELGCGVGVASLCLGHRVAGLRITGIEVQAGYAELARRNGKAAKADLSVVQADLTALKPPLSEMGFDHVLANPPFFAQGHGTATANKGKEIAFREDITLADWIDVGLRRLKQGGQITVIHLAERLPELMVMLDGRAGDIEVKPLAARQGRAAGRIILRARKSSRGIFRLHAPLVLHDGATHNSDKDSFSRQAQAVLRDGQALDFLA